MFPTVGGTLESKRDMVACSDADLLDGIMLVGIMLFIVGYGCWLWLLSIGTKYRRLGK